MAGGAGARRRWVLRVRDMRQRTIYIVTAVHAPSRTVTLHVTTPAVLHAADIRRLQRDLGDALACLLADGAEY